MPCAANEIQFDRWCVPGDPVGFVQKFYGLGLGLLGMVAFLFMLIGGYFILSSQGNPEKIEKGKSYIFYSLAGLLLAIFGFVFMQVVIGDILRAPGF